MLSSAYKQESLPFHQQNPLETLAFEVERIIHQLAAVLWTAGVSLDDAKNTLNSKIAEIGALFGHSYGACGSRVHNGKGWAEKAAKAIIPAIDPTRFLLDEKIFDFVRAADNPPTLEDIAAAVDFDVKKVKHIVAHLTGDYLVKKKQGETYVYGIVKGVDGINRGYPVDMTDFYYRNWIADHVVQKAKLGDTFSTTKPLGANGLQWLYEKVRDCDNVLPIEAKVGMLERETTERNTTPTNSTFAATVIFGPDPQYDINAIGHYLAIKHDWYVLDEKRKALHELYSLRAAFDHLAIDEFIGQLDSAEQELRELMEHATSLDDASSFRPNYRLSLVCARLG